MRDAFASAAELLEPRVLLSSLRAYPVAPLGASVDSNAVAAGAHGEMFITSYTRLYRSDGTEAGTRTVSGDVGESSAFEPVTRWNGDLYLSGRYGLGGLFKLAFGESRPVEIKTADGTGITRASDFVAAGDKLYFLSTPDNGTAGVFVTDGSSAGTRFVHGGLPLGAAGDVLIFRTTAGEPAPAASLWRTDGTPAGTFRIADTGGSDTGASLGGDFVFVTGTGVWKTDGTPEGTLPVTRDNYGTVYETRRVGDALYFTHASVSNGTRLIKTDGTAQGTAVAHTRSSSPARRGRR